MSDRNPHSALVPLRESDVIHKLFIELYTRFDRAPPPPLTPADRHLLQKLDSDRAERIRASSNRFYVFLGIALAGYALVVSRPWALHVAFWVVSAYVFSWVVDKLDLEGSDDKVNEEMSAFLNLGKDSAVGNEARAILAQIEGVDGGVYRRFVGRELRGRAEEIGQDAPRMFYGEERVREERAFAGYVALYRVSKEEWAERATARTGTDVDGPSVRGHEIMLAAWRYYDRMAEGLKIAKERLEAGRAGR